MAEPEETFILHGANHCRIKGGSTVRYCRRKWRRFPGYFERVSTVSGAWRRGAVSGARPASGWVMKRWERATQVLKLQEAEVELAANEPGSHRHVAEQLGIPRSTLQPA